jgi:hypothetical protein
MWRGCRPVRPWRPSAPFVCIMITAVFIARGVGGAAGAVPETDCAANAPPAAAAVTDEQLAFDRRDAGLSFGARDRKTD